MGTFFGKKFYFIKLDISIICLVTFFISLSLIAAWFDKVERDLYGVKTGVTLNNRDCSRLMPAEVQLVVEEMAIRYQKLPLEPRIDKENGAIRTGRSGYMIDVDETVNHIIAARENQKVKLQIIKISPRYRSSDIEKVSSIQGEYATWFHGSDARYKNISLAVKSLNNTLLWPGDIFSFNEVVGPRTPERGYLPAPVILAGGNDTDYGGGVCQVSSTLYNAAINANLQICERHPHTKPIGYVPPGKDATVAYNYLDLKIKNAYRGPIIIKTGLNNNRIWVQIWGGDKK